VNWKAVGAAARVMKKLEESTLHSQGNFHFAAIAMVPPLSHFSCRVSHRIRTSIRDRAGIGERGVRGIQGCARFGNGQTRLTDSLVNSAFDIERHAGRIDMDTGWTYMGIDLSPAPSGDVSIGAAIENLTTQPVGLSGTLTAAATITAAVQNVKVKQRATPA